MSFVKLTRAQLTGSSEVVRVGMSIRHTQTTKRAMASLRVAIGRSVAARCQIGVGKAFAFLWGTGTDVGSILIAPTTGNGGVRASTRHASGGCAVAITWSRIPREPFHATNGDAWLLGREAWGATPAAFTIGKDGLIVTLPRRWWLVTSKTDFAQDPAALDRPTARQIEAMRNEPLRGSSHNGITAKVAEAKPSLSHSDWTWDPERRGWRRANHEIRAVGHSYLTSEHECLRPGTYATFEAAVMSLGMDDDVLDELQDGVNPDGEITVEMLREAMRNEPLRVVA